MADLSSQPLDAGKPGRRMKIALFLSVALNLLFAGIVGGAVLHGPPQRHGMMGRELAFGPFTEALSPTDRVALTEAFIQAAGSPRDLRRAMTADFAAFSRALRTDPLDSAELERTAQVLKQRGSQRLELGQDLLLRRIETMSPEARKAFADRLDEIIARGPMRSERRERSGG